MKDYYVVHFMELAEDGLINVGLMRYSSQKEDVDPEADKLRTALEGTGMPKEFQSAMVAVSQLSNPHHHPIDKNLDMHISVPKSMLKEITIGTVVSVTVNAEEPKE
mgnify:CR=1 FL=1